MFKNSKKLLLSAIVAPLIFTACSVDSDITEILGTTTTTHTAEAVGALTIDSNVIAVSSSNGKYQVYNDTTAGITAPALQADHLILKDSTGSVTLELSSNCQTITSFTYTDADTNVSYSDFTNIEYSCIKGTTSSDGHDDLVKTESGISVGDIEYTYTIYDINMSGSLTNTDNDTVSVADEVSQIKIGEIYYKYDLF